MAGAGRKRESESLDLGGGGGSEPKKAKTETEVEMSQPDTMSQSSSLLESRWWEDRAFLAKYLHLKELEGFLISKGTSDHIINKIRQRRPEDAYSPHEEDVEKALEGFKQKGWFYCTHIRHDDRHLLSCNSDFPDHHLYRRLLLDDNEKTHFTTFETDMECLSFFEEFEKAVKDFKSKDPYWYEHWFEEGWHLATKLAKNFPQVVQQQIDRALEDAADAANWCMISDELECIFSVVWSMVFEEKMEYSSAFDNACTVGPCLSDYFFERVFCNPSISALLKETFNFVADKMSPLANSEEEIEQLFKKTLLENSSKLMEYYPRHIKKKMEIAKQIGIINM